MRRSGLFLAFLLVLNACAIVRPASPLPGLEPVLSTEVVMLPPGGPIPENAVAVMVFTPAGSVNALPDLDLLKYYAPQAGQRGANHVVVDHANGRRIVRAYYLRIPRVIASTPVDSAAPPRPSSGGSSASPGSGGSVRVRGHYRRDGTYVRPHTRSRPGSARSGGSRRRN